MYTYSLRRLQDIADSVIAELFRILVQAHSDEAGVWLLSQSEGELEDGVRFNVDSFGQYIRRPGVARHGDVGVIVKLKRSLTRDVLILIVLDLRFADNLQRLVVQRNLEVVGERLGPVPVDPLPNLLVRDIGALWDVAGLPSFAGVGCVAPGGWLVVRVAASSSVKQVQGCQ